MVDRINGGPLQGIWFSQDVRFASVTLTNGGDSFLTELGNSPTGNGVNGKLEECVEIFGQFGTVIGLTAVSASAFNVILDYAQQLDDAAVVTSIDTQIELIADLSVATVTVESGFGPVAEGTPG